MEGLVYDGYLCVEQSVGIEEHLAWLMEEQLAMDNALPPEKRVFIGGEIQLLVLQNKTMTIQTIHRFEDYEDLYDQMRDGVKV